MLSAGSVPLASDGLANLFSGGAASAGVRVSLVPVLLVVVRLGVTAYMSSIMLLPVVLIMPPVRRWRASCWTGAVRVS